MSCIESDLLRIRSRVDQRLGELVPPETVPPQRLHRAIRHSVLAPGKRVRPAIALLTTAHLGGDEDIALDPACAIEMVHTASLIVDDLPSMDDAKIRRGRPANHRVFGEDTATLAAFALLNRAYEVLAGTVGASESQRVEMVKVLAASIGCEGIIAGQESDLHTGTDQQCTHLLRMHEQKTGALFIAAAVIGARLAGLNGDELESVRSFARNFGLAFQVRDDLLDATGTQASIGKDVDQDAEKVTFVSLLGIEETRVLVDRLIDTAVQALAPLGASLGPLVDLAHSLSESSGQPSPGGQVQVAL